MRRIAGFLAALTVAAAGAVLYVRLAADDPARWHVEPLAGPFTGRPNQFLASPEAVAGLDAGQQMRTPVYPVAPETLAAAVDRVALAEPGTERLAGGVAEGHMTYVQRSALMRFPDYVSVRVLPAAEGARLAIFSRARFGYSDAGVNEARVRRWLAAVAADLDG